MNFDSYIALLSQRLANLQADVQLLNETRLLCQPTNSTEVRLRNALRDYAWAVRSRFWLLANEYGVGSSLPVPTNAELHVRLSALETLVAMRCGQLSTHPNEPPEDAPVTFETVQRLVSAENRLFHAFEIFPLN